MAGKVILILPLTLKHIYKFYTNISLSLSAYMYICIFKLTNNFYPQVPSFKTVCHQGRSYLKMFHCYWVNNRRWPCVWEIALARGEESPKYGWNGKGLKKGGNTVQSIKMDFAFNLHVNHDSLQVTLLYSLWNTFVSPLCLQPDLKEQL